MIMIAYGLYNIGVVFDNFIIIQYSIEIHVVTVLTMCSNDQSLNLA